jgi:Asp-tRNA(Asn)/Glu-tRNA(Gln) amidotransferase A subunit family amidase
MLTKPALLANQASERRSGTQSLAAYLEETFAHLAAAEPQIEALLPEQDRRDRLLAEAEALQNRYPNPAERPPLYGILVGVKDIFSVEGFPTRAGSELPARLFEGPEAASVGALRKAGALILGKTVTTEFAYFAPGPTRNPHNPAHTPGGSSSGSAAAVAAGFCPLALGTQTIGSVIRPAAFCGIAGFKPSYSRIDPAGLIFVSRSLDHVGLFTQDVAGMRLAAPALCQDWRAERAEDSSGDLPVLGVSDDPYLQQAEEEGLAGFEAQLIYLEKAGYIIRQVSAFPDIETIDYYHRRLMAAEMAQVHARWFNQYRDLYRPQTVELIELGRTVSSAEVHIARTKQGQLRERLAQLMAQAGIDLWVSPAAPGPAPEGIAATGNPAMNLPWTNTGLPTLTLPAGRAQNGLPLGLQLAAQFMQDEQLLAWAGRVEAALAERL